MELQVEDHPDPRDIDVLETQTRQEASAAAALGGEIALAIFVRDAGTVVAGISGWTWGDCCELRASGWRRVFACVASPRGSSPPPKPGRQRAGAAQTVHFTYAFQARGSL
jgi:hypothetical protein